MKWTLLAILAAISICSPCAASTDDDIMTCAGITGDTKARLACFDAAATMILSRKISTPENYILQRFKKKPGETGK